MRYLHHIAFLVLVASGVQAQTVYHVDVKLEGMVDLGVSAFIERVIQEADSIGVDAIVLEIDTFGGRVDAGTVIRDAILDAEALTIAFINKRAISAGALIALACDKIVMAQGATMGAVTPVDGSGTKASDKVTSYMRAELRATAERTGRNVKIVDAMVDERVDVPGLSAEAGRPATLTTEQALNWQMSDETAETMVELLRIYDLEEAEVVYAELNWAEHALRILTHPIVTSILLAVAMFGLIAEVRTPGWGLGGTLALVALGLFFGSHLVVRLAEWQELALFAAGLALLILELVAIPGFGLVGLAGITAMVTSLVITQFELSDDPALWSIDEIAWVITRMSVSMILAIVFSFVVMRSMPRFAAFRRLILDDEVKASSGYTASSRDDDEDLLGKEGVTMSFLRPSGIAMIEGRRINVIANGEFIEAQRPIKIVEARGSRVVVRAL